MAACRVMACVLLLAIPSSIIAEHQPRQGRQLLVVSKGKPAGETAVADTAKATSSGTLESTAGEDFNPPMVTKAEGKQEFPITKKSGTLQRKKGSKQSTQQQVLGSKGMPQMRQAGTLYDQNLLPFCDPSAGTVCADNDKLDLLKADAAQINMDGLYAYGEAKPSASFTGSVKNTLDGLFNTFTNAITGVTNAGLARSIGKQQANDQTTYTDTVAKTTVDGSRHDRVLPDSIGIVRDRTDATGNYVRNRLKRTFTSMLGANWGLPVGLQTVTDGPISGK